jgi:hypothetical protein
MDTIKKAFTVLWNSLGEIYEAITSTEFGILLFWIVIFVLMFDGSSCNIHISIQSE